LEELVSSIDNQAGSPAITEEEIRRLVSVVVDEAMAVKRTDTPQNPETIAIGADHGGYELKQAIGEHLRQQGLSVHDCGCVSIEAVDYPDFAHAVANLVGTGVCRWGIIVDGAGIGSCMVANKVPGVRAALCYDLSSARNSREHNHANVLTLGAGLIGQSLARQIVDEWLATPWGSDRHARRVAKITDIEHRYLRPGTEP
jgi:RpiB/LacA/LacB family sugar-phosphate isomerase